MILIVAELLSAVAASARRSMLIHVALEAGIGGESTPASWALKWTIR
jgi:hypothetical protein